MEARPVSLIAAAFLLLAASSLAETDDQYWARRSAEAIMRNVRNYQTDPFAVTNSLNAAVHKALDKKNTTRRSMKTSGKGGYCKATNPIDRCWRCEQDWADNRQKLAKCAKGFGRKAFGGGKRGEIYVVTDSSDDDLLNPKPGTLRHAILQDRHLWITFERDMVIRAQQELIMTSNKTIDGRGHNVRIAYGAGLTLQFVSNVIIHGLHIHNILSRPGGFIRDSATHFGKRTVSDGDGISIYGASNIWVDHVTMAQCVDGLVDVIQGSTAITISNSHFTNHDDCFLFGGSNIFVNDSFMQITLAFNHFGLGLIQRMPRVRFGFVHVVNNDYSQWQMYAIGGTMHPTIISQGNRFTAPFNPHAKEVTKRDISGDGSDPQSWSWTSEGDLTLNGAFFRSSGPKESFELTKNFSRFDVFRAKPGGYVPRLTRYAGALSCKAGEPC